MDVGCSPIGIGEEEDEEMVVILVVVEVVVLAGWVLMKGGGIVEHKGLIFELEVEGRRVSMSITTWPGRANERLPGSLVS